MSLDIYFPEDLERITDALQQSAMYQDNPDFRAGWLAALNAVRAAFGLRVETVIISEAVRVHPTGAGR